MQFSYYFELHCTIQILEHFVIGVQLMTLCSTSYQLGFSLQCNIVLLGSLQWLPFHLSILGVIALPLIRSGPPGSDHFGSVYVLYQASLL